MENPTTFALVRSPAPIITFPAPASSNAACGFPRTTLSCCFTSRVYAAYSAFAFTYIFRLRSCSSIGAFLISPLPPMSSKSLQTAGPLPPPALPGFTGTTSPSATLSPVSRFPGAAGYTAYLCSADFQRGEEGFSSCLARPRHRTVATTPPECRSASAVCATPCCFRPRLEDSASGPSIFRRPPVRSLSLRSGNSPPPLTVVVSMGFRASVSLLPAIQTTGLWLLPRRVYPPLNAPAFAGRT